jgi:meso-butanediol dehydrogenase / (S,S)-butanediol dehydrogenase / diacetyl reductase
MHMSEPSAEQRVIVTGGASGIGLATVNAFVRAGARVAIFDIDEDALARAAAQVGDACRGFAVDVTSAGSVSDGFERAHAWLGGLDALVANAGISVRRAFRDISPEEWDRVLAVNLRGVFLCAQAAAARMMEAGGAILMTASTNGIAGYPYYASYNASKAGVISLARSMAIELAPRIRVNAVCPGYVLTPMQEREYTEAMLARVNAKIPLGRHARPEEIADLFVFLASPQARYINGQTIVIDGGELAGGLASAGVPDQSDQKIP